MNRLQILLLAIVLPALLFAAHNVRAYKCPPPMEKKTNGDCGLFPDDPDIMRVPANDSGAVVARWRSSTGKPVRIINRSENDIPVFLRTEEEFRNFLAHIEDVPDVDSCEVVDQPWHNTGQCAYLTSGGAKVVPGDCFLGWDRLRRRTACDKVYLAMYHTCSGTSCGGTCDYRGPASMIQGNIAGLWVHPTAPPFPPCEPGCLRKLFDVKEGCAFNPWRGGQSAKLGEIRVQRSRKNFDGEATVMCTRSGDEWNWKLLRYTCSCPGTRNPQTGYCIRDNS